MSRYDWGGTNPAIGRLKEAIDPARLAVAYRAALDGAGQ